MKYCAINLNEKYSRNDIREMTHTFLVKKMFDFIQHMYLH